MDKYRKIMKERDTDAVKDDEEIRITAVGSVSAYVSRAAKVYGELDKSKVVIKAQGNALTKAVTLAEVIKRRFKGLHQVTTIGSNEVVDEYEPLEEGLDKVSETRQIPFIHITLSKEALDTTDKGYQAPIEESLVKEYDEEEMNRGRGKGRGKGKGKGKGKESKGKGKGKGKESEPKGKGKGKGKETKGKGKGKGKEVETKGKGKGKDKGKGKGKDEPKGKGKGKDSKGKGKGKESSKGKGKSTSKGKSSWDRDDDWYGSSSYSKGSKGKGKSSSYSRDDDWYGSSYSKGKSSKGKGKSSKGWSSW